jgi:hypothetical protein
MPYGFGGSVNADGHRELRIGFGYEFVARQGARSFLPGRAPGPADTPSDGMTRNDRCDG